MEQLIQDIRFAARSLVRRPGFAAVASVTLALGVGATTAIFSVVSAVLLEPLPYHDAEELVTLWQTDRRGGADRQVVSFPNFRDWREATESFSGMVAYTTSGAAFAGPGDARIVPAARVTSGLFRMFRADLVDGRDFRSQEELAGGPDLVVIGHGFWMDELGGSQDAVGRSLNLNGRPFEIIGVAPPGFDFPEGARLWLPLQQDEGCGRDCQYLRVVARLAPGVGVERAGDELGAVATRLEEVYPEENPFVGAEVVTLHEHVVGDVKLGLWVLLGAVGMVLLIACANVANLLLVRGGNREGEVAIRAALGASGGRLVRQFLTESLVLAVVGGGLGLLLAVWGVELLHLASPGEIPRLERVRIDGPVLAFTACLVVLTTAVFGVGPAFRMARRPVARALAGTGPWSVGRSRGAGPGRSLLLVAEVALSLSLLAGAGLLLRSLDRLHAVELGFDPAGLAVATLSLPETRYPEPGQRAAFFDKVQLSLGSRPEVSAVGAVLGSPLGGSVIASDFTVEGRPALRPGEHPIALLRVATPGYLETLGVPVLRGRGFTDADRYEEGGVALVSQSTAERFWPGADPLGERIRLGVSLRDDEPVREVVGVVADVRSQELERDAAAEIYIPHAQAPVGVLTLVARAGSGDAAGLIPVLRRHVQALDPQLALIRPGTLADRVDRSLAQPRFYALLLGLFAALAVTLASVGLYGALAYLVSRRTREIGIRIALGADAGEVVGMVLDQGIRPVLLGLVAGAAASLAGSRLLSGLLYQVEPHDPVALVGGTLILGAVAVAAVLIPAFRAARIAPAVALREE